jgi:hypothetical protein
MEEYSHNMNFVGVVGSPHNFSNCLSGQTICCCGSGLVASNVISHQLNNYMPFNSVSSRAKSDMRRFEVFNCPSFFGGFIQKVPNSACQSYTSCPSGNKIN